MKSRPTPLTTEYEAEFDRVERDEWHALLQRFSDASLYQTWDYDAVRCGERNLSHLVLRRGGDIVAVAQARLVRVPVLGWGAAYVRWGPVWRQRRRAEDRDVLRMALRALRNEYVCRRGLMLRVFPPAFADNSDQGPVLLADELYFPTPDEKPQQTLLLNLEGPLAELRTNFHQKWRNCLNHAERNSLTVTQGTEDELFAQFIALYRQMLSRKQFTEPNDIREFREIQKSLPEPMKMGVFLCTENGTLTAGAICSAIGENGVYLFGATNEQGMKNKGAYLLQRHALQWLQDRGCKHYNLNGINPLANPGSYHFKTGLAGKRGQEFSYLGRFDCCGGLAQRAMAHFGQRTLPLIKRALGAAKAVVSPA